ncbi:MAG: peptidylprolyl isomerase [Candidatus Anstonellaceae archaeon]
MKKIKKGDHVVLDYVGKFEDGTIFDRSGAEHFEFVVGENQVIAGFEKNILNMQKGEKKSFEVSPSEGYGPYHEELKVEFPIEKLPKDSVVGSILVVSDKNGNEALATVLEINQEQKTALLDLNHPMAGKKLIFEVAILDIKQAN